jgi:hypothetical protein
MCCLIYVNKRQWVNINWFFIISILTSGMVAFILGCASSVNECSFLQSECFVYSQYATIVIGKIVPTFSNDKIIYKFYNIMSYTGSTIGYSSTKLILLYCKYERYIGNNYTEGILSLLNDGSVTMVYAINEICANEPLIYKASTTVVNTDITIITFIGIIVLLFITYFCTWHYVIREEEVNLTLC